MYLYLAQVSGYGGFTVIKSSVSELMHTCPIHGRGWRVYISGMNSQRVTADFYATVITGRIGRTSYVYKV